MKPLNQIFSERDCEQLVEWASGKKQRIQAELVTYDVELIRKKYDETDRRRIEFEYEHGGVSQELVVTFGFDHEPAVFQLRIGEDGDVAYTNFGGCRFRFRRPLDVYRLVTKRFEEASFAEKKESNLKAYNAAQKAQEGNHG